MTSSETVRLVLLAAAMLASSVGLASTPASETTVELRLGGFLLTGLRTEIQLGTAHGATATLIDFERTLGGDTSLDIFRADADWHFGNAHSLQASWYDVDSRGRRTIATPISWGGDEFTPDTTLESRLRTNIYKVTYGYTFHRGARHEYVALVGAHILQVDASIREAGSPTLRGFSATAPLPAFGAGWIAHWTERFVTRAFVQYFGISLDQGRVEGHLVDTLVSAQYRIGQQWGVGAGYNRFKIDAELSRGDLRLELDHSYHGVLAYLFFGF